MSAVHGMASEPTIPIVPDGDGIALRQERGASRVDLEGTTSYNAISMCML